MRLTTKGRFAVTAMIDLAMRDGERPRHARGDLGAAEDLAVLPGAAVREAAAPGAGASTRGPGGGYRLAKPTDTVSVAEIIIAVDEPIDATQCGGKRTAGTSKSASHMTFGRA